jgi:hypothetical protein
LKEGLFEEHLVAVDDSVALMEGCLEEGGDFGEGMEIEDEGVFGKGDRRVV